LRLVSETKARKAKTFLFTTIFVKDGKQCAFSDVPQTFFLLTKKHFQNLANFEEAVFIILFSDNDHHNV
jgi:hypothetical protein